MSSVVNKSSQRFAPKGTSNRQEKGIKVIKSSLKPTNNDVKNISTNIDSINQNSDKVVVKSPGNIENNTNLSITENVENNKIENPQQIVNQPNNKENQNAIDLMKNSNSTENILNSPNNYKNNLINKNSDTVTIKEKPINIPSTNLNTTVVKINKPGVQTNLNNKVTKSVFQPSKSTTNSGVSAKPRKIPIIKPGAFKIKRPNTSNSFTPESTPSHTLPDSEERLQSFEKNIQTQQNEKPTLAEAPTIISNRVSKSKNNSTSNFTSSSSNSSYVKRGPSPTIHSEFESPSSSANSTANNTPKTPAIPTTIKIPKRSNNGFVTPIEPPTKKICSRTSDSNATPPQDDNLFLTPNLANSIKTPVSEPVNSLYASKQFSPASSITSTGSAKSVGRRSYKRRVPSDPTLAYLRTTRSKSPELGEEIKLEIDKVTMADLCHDIRVGKKSSKFQEFESIRLKRKYIKQHGESPDQLEKRMKREDEEKKKLEEMLDSGVGNSEFGAPQVKLAIVDGKIVANEDSLTIDRHDVNTVDNEISMSEKETLNIYEKRINSAAWSKREKTERWDMDETALFYTALSMWGTDFNLIAQMFKNRSRRQIKSKFNAEERKNPGRVRDALMHKIPVDLSTYEQLAGTQFSTVEEVEQDINKVRELHSLRLQEQEPESTTNSTASAITEVVVSAVTAASNV